MYIYIYIITKFLAPLLINLVPVIKYIYLLSATRENDIWVDPCQNNFLILGVGVELVSFLSSPGQDSRSTLLAPVVSNIYGLKFNRFFRKNVCQNLV